MKTLFSFATGSLRPCFLFLCLHIAFVCNGFLYAQPSKTHYIGQPYLGGVIFYLWHDSTGTEHGLVVDIRDADTLRKWSNVEDVAIGLAAASTWDGNSNSLSIISQEGHKNSAAAVCLRSERGGQKGWYLPSLDELSLLWHSRFQVNKALTYIPGASPLSTKNLYWSSTEDIAGVAWAFDFAEGKAANDDKFDAFHVRAVRSF